MLWPIVAISGDFALSRLYYIYTVKSAFGRGAPVLPLMEMEFVEFCLV